MTDTPRVTRKSYMQQLGEVHLSMLTRKLGRTGADKFDSFINDVQLVQSGKKVGQDGMLVAHMEYQAEFSFEQIPNRSLSAQALMAQTMCWLMENVDSKDVLSPPKVDSDAYSNDGQNLCDIDITISFREPIMMRQSESDQGDVFFQGKWWMCEEFDVWTAESFSVTGAKKDGVEA